MPSTPVPKPAPYVGVDTYESLKAAALAADSADKTTTSKESK